MKSHRIAEAERKVAKFHAVSEGWTNGQTDKLEATFHWWKTKKWGKTARKLECTSVFFSLWFLNTNVRRPSADRKACVLPDLGHSYKLSNHWHIVPFFIDIFIPIFWSLWFFFFSFIQSLLGLTPPKIILNWCSSLK